MARRSEADLSLMLGSLVCCGAREEPMRTSIIAAATSPGCLRQQPAALRPIASRSAEAAARSARELGADKEPKAQLHLKLATRADRPGRRS